MSQLVWGGQGRLPELLMSKPAELKPCRNFPCSKYLSDEPEEMKLVHSPPPQSPDTPSVNMHFLCLEGHSLSPLWHLSRLCLLKSCGSFGLWPEGSLANVCNRAERHSTLQGPPSGLRIKATFPGMVFVCSVTRPLSVLVHVFLRRNIWFLKSWNSTVAFS